MFPKPPVPPPSSPSGFKDYGCGSSMGRGTIGSEDGTGESFFRAIQQALNSIMIRMSDWIRPKVDTARTVGISVVSYVGEFIRFLKDILIEYIPHAFLRLVDLVVGFLVEFLEKQVEKVSSWIGSQTNGIKNACAFFAALFISAMALALPRGSLTTYGRILMAMMGAITLYVKTWTATSFTLAFGALVLKMRPATSNINVFWSAQGERLSDWKDWSIEAVGLVTMLGFGMIGLDLPKDAKSIEALLKRHALLSRATSGLKEISEKIVVVFEKSMKLFYKYSYGTEYFSTYTIPEIDNLYHEVIELTRMESVGELQSDQDKMAQVEALYVHYQQLCLAYTNNKQVSRHLQQIGGVLTWLYRQVVLKNPRSYKMRMEPTCVVFVGPTGVGKSYLLNPLQQDLLKICGKLDVNMGLSGKIYSRCVEQEFWDGYHGQPIVIYDDLGQKVDSQVNPNIEFFELIRTINIFPYQLHSAALEQKANNAFMADFVLGTSNLRNWNPQSLVDAKALERRMHLVYYVDVIDEVKTDDKLDVDKLRTYRRKKNLPFFDCSHWVFTNEETGEKVDYSAMVVQISSRYRTNYESYEERTRISDARMKLKLPEGSFSTNSERWCPQGDENYDVRQQQLKIPIGIFANCHQDVRLRIMQVGHSVVMTPKILLEARDSLPMLVDYDEMISIVEADSKYNRYCEDDSAEVIRPQVLLHVHRLLLIEYGERDFESAAREVHQNLLLAKERFARRASIGKQFDTEYLGRFYKFWYSYKCWKQETSIPMDRITRILHLGLVMSGCILMYGWWNNLYEWIANQFNIGKGKRLVVLVLQANHFRTAFEMRHMTVPFHGYCNLVSWVIAFVNHYWQHPMYERDCKECASFERGQEEIEKHHTGINPEGEILPDVVQRKVAELSLCKDLVTYQGGEDEWKKIEDKAKKISTAVNDVIESIPKEDLQRHRFLVRAFLWKAFCGMDMSSPLLDTAEEEDLLSTEGSSGGHSVSSAKDEKNTKDKRKLPATTQYGKSVFVTEDIDEEIKQLFPGIKQCVNAEAAYSQQAENLGRVVRRNMNMLFIRWGDNIKKIGMTVTIKGNKALINYHYLQTIGFWYAESNYDPSFLCELRQPEQEKGHLFSIEQFATAKAVNRGEFQTEFYIWTLPKSFPLGRDLSKHMIHPKDIEKLHRGVRIMLLSYDKEGGVCVRAKREGPFLEVFTAELQDTRNPEMVRVYPSSVQYDISTLPGDCGGALILNHDAFEKKLLGFHFGGLQGRGSGSIICYGDVEEWLKNEIEGFDEENFEVEGASGKVTAQGEEDDGFPLRSGCFHYIGMAEPQVVQPLVTALRPSLIYEFAGPSQVAPAVLRPALEEEGPMIQGLLRGSTSPRQVDQRILNMCALELQDTLFHSPVTEIETKVMCFEQACMGIPGEDYFPPLKRSKSAGWPYMGEKSRGKTKWLGQDEWDFNSESALQLRREVNRIEQLCIRGQQPSVLFVDTMKDEKLSLEKVKAGRTRIFSAAPMHLSILIRKYFLPFVAYLARTRITNEIAVGTNVYSRDWELIVRHLNRFPGLSCLAGDFRNFDDTMVYEIFEKIVDIVNVYFCDSKQNQKVRKVLWKTICNSPHLLMKYVYVRAQGQPSGSPLTAPTNSMYVSLLLRYCFAKLFIGSPDMAMRYFKTYVRVITYGDDFVCTVAPAARENFSGRMLQQEVFKLGMELVREDKSEGPIEYKSLEDVTFLKRKFSYDADLGWWFAPLSMRSIIEMCNWITKTPSDIEATLDNCKCAQFELFHHDEATYDELRQKISVALSRIGLKMPWLEWKAGRYMIAYGLINDTLDGLLHI